MIGGNITAILQKKTVGSADPIGECEITWSDALTLTGWLDLLTGSAKHTEYSAKLEESTHVFLCDWQSLGELTSENARLLIGGTVYEVTLIDDPVGLHRQLEIYLKYAGGQ